MVKKRNSSKSKVKASKVDNDANTAPEKVEVVASTSDDGIVVGIEEVEAEIVDDGVILDESHVGDEVDASAPPLYDDDHSDANINEIVDGDDEADEVLVDAVVSEEASKAPLPPGIVFLGVLGVVGIMGAGLWMNKSNSDKVAASGAVFSPLDQGASSQKTNTQKADVKTVTNKVDGEKTVSNKKNKSETAVNQNSKIANKVSDKDIKNGATIVAEQAKVAAVDESKINSLPTPLKSQDQDGISQTQAAAKEAAKQAVAGVSAAANIPVGENVDNVIEETSALTSPSLTTPSPSTPSPVEEAAELFASDPKEVASDIKDENVDNEGVNDGQLIVEAQPDEVTQLDQGDQGAPREANTPTPDEQLGADPIEAIKSLQEEADARLTAEDAATLQDQDAIENGFETQDVTNEAIVENIDNAVGRQGASAQEDITSLDIADSDSSEPDSALTGAETVLAEIDAAGDQATPDATTNEVIGNEVTGNEVTGNNINGAVATLDEGPAPSGDVRDTQEAVETLSSEESDDTIFANETSAQISSLAQNADILNAQNQAVAQVTDKFAGEIAALEESFEERTARITEALNFERERAAGQAEEIANLKSQLEQTLAANEQRSNENIENLRTRIDALQNDEAEKANNTERQTASLLSLISVQRSFDQGVSFERELKVLKNAMPSDHSLTALEAAATTGAPTLATLKESFPDAIRTTLAGSQKGAKGPMGHFMRNIKSLVSVRPATPQGGDTVPAIISRAEGYLLRDDLASTLREVATLKSAASADMVEWIEKAQLRHAAVLSLNTINDDLLSGIGN